MSITHSSLFLKLQETFGAVFLLKCRPKNYTLTISDENLDNSRNETCILCCLLCRWTQMQISMIDFHFTP